SRRAQGTGAGPLDPDAPPRRLPAGLSALRVGGKADPDRRLPHVGPSLAAAAAGQCPGRRHGWRRAHPGCTGIACGSRAVARGHAAGHGQSLRTLGRCRMGAPRGRRPGPGLPGRSRTVFLLTPGMEYLHRPVLLEPTVDALVEPGFGARPRWAAAARPAEQVLNGVFVDGTFGRGGHSRHLLAKLGPQARLVVFDKDPQAIAAARQLQAQDARVHVVHGGYASMEQALQAQGVHGVDGVMLDLGVSSPQIDDAQRGFSFMREGPLDMRMDTSRGLTAAQWLEEAGVDELREVIADYGEERFAFQIAKAIVARRESRPLRTTLELAELVASVVRTREKGQHPATRTFQALRIHLNRELQELK